MLEFYVKSDVKLRQLRQSPAGTHLDALAGWLRSAGYRQRPAQLALRGAAHLSHWAKARGLPTARLGEGILDAFVGHLSTCVCPHPFRGRDSYHVLQATGDVRKVALWLGHESVQTTEDYLRVDVTQRLALIESMTPPQLRPGKFRPPDKLIASLTG